jgi:hypothetical protein
VLVSQQSVGGLNLMFDLGLPAANPSMDIG